MKLYVDDIREAPEGWTLAKTITEAINFIALYGSEIEEISLDHDISFDVQVEGTYRPFPSPDNFSAVAHFIAVYYHLDMYRFPTKPHPKITIHTSNPAGANHIVSIMGEHSIGCQINMMGAATRKK